MAAIQGLSYYRLRQNDTDGTRTYSDVVAVDLGTVVPIHAVYDGTKGWEIKGPIAEDDWVLLDAMGRTVTTASLTPRNGHHHLDIGTVQDGLLLFTVRNGEARFTIKLPPTAREGDVIAFRALE
jgi:hypothetical protein